MNCDLKRGRSSSVLPVLLGLGLVFAAGEAQAEPPIKSPQDAYCRTEARARVFGEPDPRNVGMHEIGRRLYSECMRRISGPKRSQRRSHHRRRR